MKKRFTEQQIVAILQEGEAGVPAKEICRKHNISDATFYTWRKKYRGMETEDIRRLKQLEAENQKLKRLLADSMLDNDALKAALSKKILTPRDKRKAIAVMQDQTAISQRRACCLGGVIKIGPELSLREATERRTTSRTSQGAGGGT